MLRNGGSTWCDYGPDPSPHFSRTAERSQCPVLLQTCPVLLLVQFADSCRLWIIREPTTPVLLANVWVALERTRLHCRSKSTLSHAKSPAPAALDCLSALESVVPVLSKLPRDLQHPRAGWQPCYTPALLIPACYMCGGYCLVTYTAVRRNTLYAYPAICGSCR